MSKIKGGGGGIQSPISVVSNAGDFLFILVFHCTHSP